MGEWHLYITAQLILCDVTFPLWANCPVVSGMSCFIVAIDPAVQFRPACVQNEHDDSWKMGPAGYGDNLNIMDSIQLMKQYVVRQNKIWLALEMDKGRSVDLADVEDPRVDLCLFCIQAHRLRPVDLRWAPLRCCKMLTQAAQQMKYTSRK